MSKNVLKITKTDGSIHFAPALSLPSHQAQNNLRKQHEKYTLTLITEAERDELIEKGELIESVNSKSDNLILKAKQEIADKQEELSLKDKEIETLRKELEAAKEAAAKKADEAAKKAAAKEAAEKK